MNASTLNLNGATFRPEPLPRRSYRLRRGLAVALLLAFGLAHAGCRPRTPSTRSPRKRVGQGPRESRSSADLVTAKSPDPCQELWAKVWRTEQRIRGGEVVKKGKLRAQAKSLQGCPDDQSVAFAMGQALIWSRLAQGRGMGGLSAFRKAEAWVKIAFARDPEFRAGLPRRVLGSMWAIGGQHLDGADPELGLEHLMDQVNRYPSDPENVVRLVEGLCALQDVEGAHEVYCIYSRRKDAWKLLSHESLQLRASLQQIFDAEHLVCPKTSSSSR